MRVLIIRFSSFGDIFQALVVPPEMRRAWKIERLSWLTRADFADLLRNQESIDEVIAFDRRASLLDLIALAWRLGDQFDTIYDAHANLRSLVVRWVIRVRWFSRGHFHRLVFIRSKERIRRLLFFKLRLNSLPSPYRGAESFLWPLFKNSRAASRANKRAASRAGELNGQSKGGSFDLSKRTWRPDELNADFKSWHSVGTGPIIAFAPSAAWPNKRWPTERWSELAALLISRRPELRYVLLGGPEDGFLNTIAESLGTKRAFNGVGRLTLVESASLLSACQLVVANDTGLLHVADRLQIPIVAIIGPTAFGYPSSPLAKVAEVDRQQLPCKPCSKDGRDPCRNPENLKCLTDVTVAHVANLALESLA